MNLQFNDAGVAAAFQEMREQLNVLSERCAAHALKSARQAEEIAGYKVRVEQLTSGDPAARGAASDAVPTQ